MKKFILLIAMSICVSSANAEMLTIADCNGIVRLSKDTKKLTADITIAISGAAENTLVNLTNISTGETVSAYSTATGKVSIKYLKAGAWKACTLNSDNVQFTDISLNEGKSVGGIALTTAGLIGGGIAALSIDGGSNGTSTEAAPIDAIKPPQAAPHNTTGTTSTHGSSNTPAESCNDCSCSQGAFSNNDCLTGGNPTPLSPIS